MGLDLVTTADIARECQVLRGRVNYVLMAQHIEPSARAGSVRLYRPITIERVRGVLKEQDERRKAKLVTA